MSAWRGLSPLWQGKDLKCTYVHERTFMLPPFTRGTEPVIRLEVVIYMNMGVARTTLVTSHHTLRSGGGFDLSQIAERLLCRVEKRAVFYLTQLWVMIII